MITNPGVGGAYKPVLGDRVRVVLEGEVTALGRYNPGAFEVGSSNDAFPTLVNPARRQVLSVEKLSPPLPTTPGSVVRHISGYLYARDLDHWRGIDSGLMHDCKRFTPVGDYTVLFDANTLD